MNTTTKKPVLDKVKKGAKNQNNIATIQKNVRTIAETGKTETEKKAINEARETLKARSQEVKKLVESGEFETINDAIMETMYRNETHQEFKSYGEWQKEGFQVRKGEKAFLLWGRPKEISQPNEEHENGNEKEEPDEKHEYFPVTHLFSNAQVDPKEHEHDEPLDEIDDIRNEGHEEEMER